MRRLFSLLLIFTLALITVNAQINGDGYYRIMNYGIYSNKKNTNGSKQMAFVCVTYNQCQIATNAGTTQNFEALQLFTNDINDDVVYSDPAAILYLTNPFEPSKCNVQAQGMSLRSQVGGDINLSGSQNNYVLSGVKSGVAVTLGSTNSTVGSSVDKHYVVTSGAASGYQYWSAYKVDHTSANTYLGVKPTLKAANGKYYQPYYVAFPFQPIAGQGMKVYYVSNYSSKYYELKEITGIVPANTPVLIECTSDNPANNKLQLYAPTTRGTRVTDNKLAGNFFCNTFMISDSYPNAVTKFNQGTMRVWNIDAKGNLVLSTSTDNMKNNIRGGDKYRGYCIKPNQSYLAFATTENLQETLMSAGDARSTITFDTDGGTAVEPISSAPGFAVTAPANPTKTGYTFTGWSPALPTVMPENDLTVKAQWQANSYTITFDTDGGSTVAAITKNYGEAVTAPQNPTKTGYTFTGWDKTIPSTMPAESQTIKAQWQINSYTITFDTDGGSAVAAITKNYGEAVTAPQNPTKTGYTFTGWDKTIPSTMPAESQTIKAQWQANSYTITFDTDGGSTVDAITKNYGEAVTAPQNPTKAGYTFTGWDKTIPSTMPAESQTIKALWQINSYTITFDTDGGSTVDAITKNYGEAVTAPQSPTKTGYTFTGWDKTIPSTMPAESQTIKALWQINQYTVKFVMDNGSVIKEEKLNYGAAITAPATNPTKTGAEFIGWSPTVAATVPANDVTYTATFSDNDYTITFDTDGGTAVSSITAKYGTIVTAPQNPTKTGYTFTGWDKEIPATIPAGNITIKAQWQANSYTITFDTDGGSTVAAITKNYGEAVTAPQNPTKTGYTFTGWDKTIPSTMPAESQTIKAQWQINSYTITFDTDGGSTVDAITKNYGEAVTAPQSPTKTGYTFTGWDKTIPSTMPAENQTIKAQWQINSYTITFDTDGGSTVDAITKNYGEAVTAPQSPTKTGYTFTGWDKTIPSTMPAESQTIKAQWQINQYTVTFNLDGGNIEGETTKAITQDYATQIIAPAAPEKLYYTFTGWDKEIPAMMPAEDVTINAQWAVATDKRSISLSEGWNWIAFNISSTDLLSLDKALSSGKWTNGDEVKDGKDIAAYSKTYGKWVGNLMRQGALGETLMYKVKSSETQTLTIDGTVIVPSKSDITIVKGWNYIAYTPLVVMDINEALANYNKYIANEGDVIKSQDAFATFTRGQWQGELKTLKPGDALMLKYTGASAKAQTFTFPDNATVEPGPEPTSKPHRYASNMSVIADVQGAEAGDEIVAVANGEVRGAATVGEDGMTFLTVEGDATESISLLLNRNGETVMTASKTFRYENDAVLGSLSEPTQITFAEQAPTTLQGTVVAIATLDGKSLDSTDINSLPAGTYIVTTDNDGVTNVVKINKK